jgi:hypothetical protein
MSMQPLNFEEVRQYVSRNIVIFHQNKINKIARLKLKDLIRRKNPYLFKAKNVTIASDLIKDIFEAYLSSSEEKMFGDFLEGLAIFVAERTCGGAKSAAQGIDLEIDRENIRYLISIKSGPNWGNNSQKNQLVQNFDRAKKVLLQSKAISSVQPILGICYGKAKKTVIKNHLKLEGQEFWTFISGNKNLYIEIIEPVGHEAKKHNDNFLIRKGEVINSFTKEFMENYCTPSGQIDWGKLVEFNSGNLNS